MAENKESSSSKNQPGFLWRMTISGISKKWPKAKQMTTNTLHETMQKNNENQSETNLYLLDTREKEEFDVSHIPGAMKVDAEAGDLEETIRKLKLLENEKSVVVCYCALGYRSCRYATYLQDYIPQNKQKNVEIYNLEGSIFQWANEGRPLVDFDQKSTVFCHPYSTVWGKFLKSELRKEKY